MDILVSWVAENPSGQQGKKGMSMMDGVDMDSTTLPNSDFTELVFFSKNNSL